MSKSNRKATGIERVSPFQLWEMFHGKFPNGEVSPWEFARLGKKFEADIAKVHFDFENHYYSHLDEGLGRADGFLGYRKLWVQGGCMPYIGWTAGGDWEHPVNFLVYLDGDGKAFRAYVPQDGNVWNYDTKIALGNDDGADERFLKKWLKKNTPDLAADWEFTGDDGGLLADPARMGREMMGRFEAVK